MFDKTNVKAQKLSGMRRTTTSGYKGQFFQLQNVMHSSDNKALNMELKDW